MSEQQGKKRQRGIWVCTHCRHANKSKRHTCAKCGREKGKLTNHFRKDRK